VSAEATAWAKRVKTGDATRKAILRALADYAGPGKADRDAPAEADGRHFTFVGLETLAEECECSERTIVRHLNALKAAGSIVRVRRMRGFIRTSDYTVLAVDGYGPRPFTDAEALLADGLDSVDDNLTSTGLTGEDAILSPSVDDTLAPTGTCHSEPPKVTPVSPSEHDTGVTCVPYTGTISNYEPEAELPAPRDDHSPAFLLDTMITGGVRSGHTPTLKEFGESVRATTEEIMGAWQKWVDRRLPSVTVVEVSKIVKSCVADGVERRQIALGLKDWTEAGMIAPKFRLPDAISARVTAPLRNTPASRPQETKAGQRRQRLSEAVATATSDADLMGALRSQSAKLGVGSAAFAAIEGMLA
jgi:DNA-binding transcriptional ArsR family regulator